MARSHPQRWERAFPLHRRRLSTLRNLHEHWGDRLWTRYGYRDAFNPTKDWVADDVLGIDHGAMMVMIENHRTGGVWRRMMGHPVIRRAWTVQDFDRCLGIWD